MKEYDLVVFNENHKWFPCVEYIREIKPNKIMVGVPIPEQGTGYIFCKQEDIEVVGEYPFRENF